MQRLRAKNTIGNKSSILREPKKKQDYFRCRLLRSVLMNRAVLIVSLED
jgi:hypothetical protein